MCLKEEKKMGLRKRLEKLTNRYLVKELAIMEMANSEFSEDESHMPMVFMGRAHILKEVISDIRLILETKEKD
jgi:hypothetical protein